VLLRELREQVVEAGVKLVEGHLVYLSAGNVSARDPETSLVAVKPSGGDYLRLQPEDILIIDLDGRVVDGRGQVSSETPMHLAAYHRRQDVNAAIHTHSPVATAWGVAEREIPPVTVGQVLTNGPIPFAPYRRPGSAAIGEAAMDAMGTGFAVILQNHGPFVVGTSMRMALATAFIVEEAAIVAVNAFAVSERLRLMTEGDFVEMLGGDTIG
jgi:ribulose-5-phosphate 4-epimerase/fuculose-1-phosphate aldolase